MKVWLLGIGVLFLGVIIVILSINIYLLRKAACELEEAFSERLSSDSNTLIDISTRDKYMLRLANRMNEQLIMLRKQRHNILSGDRELKEAVTNISHDLRTPLTAICGYLDLLEQEEKSDKVARYLSYISNRTEVMKQLTEELFHYSMIVSTEDEMVLEPVNLNSVLEDSIASIYSALVESGITPVIHMPEELVIRRLNRVALARVFGNVLNNALKYSDGDLEISMLETGEITFSNTASGLDEVQVGKLFNRFFTVEAARKSTGLGLAISKTLVEQMKGKMSAKYEARKLSICIAFYK